MKTIGIIFLVSGIVLMIFTGTTFFTKETIADLGVIEITRNKPNYITWSPIIGIVLMGIGALTLFKASKK
ncbi:MAG: hypothetical protein ACK4ND_12985 [Cytophagaceae bacterium]